MPHVPVFPVILLFMFAIVLHLAVMSEDWTGLGNVMKPDKKETGK